MENHIKVPYSAQDPQEVKTLVQNLEASQGKKSGKGGFSCRKNVFPVAGSQFKVASWKMSDWDYKKPNLPTYARGLFTYRNSRGEDEIAVRGYDKFFNHGEVRKTEWRNVEANTRGPYELSVKENGCIIFMSGLEDGTLLVCSKHSTGNRDDIDVSHAAVGETWVEKHLASVGKSKKQFAHALRDRNITAVAELCDDSFEEHVLEYKPEESGLYLHGVNLNLPKFATYPAELVDAFAEEWGLKKTMHLIMDDITSVKQFLDESAETGSYAGRSTEGFVIRCQARDDRKDPWSDWFFKYKFEEPYLMYRQWRECTKALIAKRQPKVKKHNKITWLYLEYAKKRLEEDPTLGPAYQHNHGIIKLRDDFLQQAGLTGEDVIKQAEESKQGDADTTKNVVLVPVATIGCGKTTVALALVKLFGWGHVQNDNIQGKGRPPRFAKAVAEELEEYPVVIADRNNHQKHEREQLFTDVHTYAPTAKYVALHYRHKAGNDEDIRETTRERVFSRGDNHQTIQAGSKRRDFVIDIMEGFMKRFQPVDQEREPDSNFDHVIELDATLDSRENLETVITSLQREFPVLLEGKMPSAEDMDDAIQYALSEYRPDIKHIVGSAGPDKGKNKPRQVAEHNGHPKPADAAPKKQKPAKVEYFGVTVPFARVLSVLEQNFAKADAETSKFYKQLQSMRRVQQEFHVTLIHRSEKTKHMAYWEQLLRLADEKGLASSPVMGQVQVQLDRILWDDRIMAIKVVLLPVDKSDGESFFKTTNTVAHITVGTADASIKPKESNDMLVRWWNDNSEGIQEIGVSPYTEVPGEVKPVLQKF